MLRFDLPPVWSNVTRWEAFLTFTISAIALAANLPWLMLLLAVQGGLRGFRGHYADPGHRLWVSVFESRGWGGRKENAGAKMFAAKILFVAAAVSVLLALAGSPMWQVPAAVLVAFSFLEWAFSFCAACWVYGAWYARFPPKGS